jgi:Flp pilus assembly protein TadG
VSLRRQLFERRSPRDQGVALVELALVVPFLAMLALGIMEYGNAWRQVAGLERATQQSARTVSSLATDRYADYEALRAADTLVRGLSGLEIENVVIYLADETGVMPDGCGTASIENLCNFYTATQVATTSPVGFGTPSAVNPSCTEGSWDEAWCPTEREREGAAADHIGVRLTVTYSPITGLLPAEFMTITRYAVYRIEPCAQGQTSC